MAGRERGNAEAVDALGMIVFVSSRLLHDHIQQRISQICSEWQESERPV